MKLVWTLISDWHLAGSAEKKKFLPGLGKKLLAKHMKTPIPNVLRGSGGSMADMEGMDLKGGEPGVGLTEPLDSHSLCRCWILDKILTLDTFHWTN